MTCPAQRGLNPSTAPPRGEVGVSGDAVAISLEK